MHGRPTLFAAIDALPTCLPHRGVECALSVGDGLLVLPLPLHLGVLHEGLGGGRSAGTLAAISALFTAGGDLQLGQDQGGEAEQNQAPDHQLHPDGVINQRERERERETL